MPDTIDLRKFEGIPIVVSPLAERTLTESDQAYWKHYRSPSRARRRRDRRRVNPAKIAQSLILNGTLYVRQDVFDNLIARQAIEGKQ